MSYMPRPETTLFMLMSVDGKISTGDTDALDFDRDLKLVDGVKEGLGQYYEAEKQTDLFSLNTGRVMAKIGLNARTDEPKKIPCSFVIIDNKPHLTLKGIEYLSKWVKTLFLVTTNKEHPVFQSQRKNVVPMLMSEPTNFGELFETLRTKHGVDRLTIQSGGTLNATLIREGLIDHLSIVVAPIVVGGKTTATLADGEALHATSEVSKLKALKLVSSNVLADSYLHLKYDVVN